MAKSDRKSEGRKAGRTAAGKKQGKSSSALTHEARQDGSSSSDKPHRPGAFTKNDPRINRKIPGPGRPPGKFARKCRRLVSRPKTWRAVRRVIQNPDNPAMKGMWTEVTNRGFGKQNSNVDLRLPPGTDDDGNERPNAVVLLMGRLDQMEKRKEKAKDTK
jgi:hypothetical protein